MYLAPNQYIMGWLNPQDCGELPLVNFLSAAVFWPSSAVGGRGGHIDAALPGVPQWREGNRVCLSLCGNWSVTLWQQGGTATGGTWRTVGSLWWQGRSVPLTQVLHPTDLLHPLKRGFPWCMSHLTCTSTHGYLGQATPFNPLMIFS